MTDEKTPTFDLATWITQGETALERLQAREGELVEELHKVQEEQDSILIAMGRYKGPTSTPEAADAPQKVMIRPLLKEVLIEADGHGLSLDEVVDLVQAKQPRARRKSIEVSLHRLARAHARVEEYEVAEGATHWKMVLDHDSTIVPDAPDSEEEDAKDLAFG